MTMAEKDYAEIMLEAINTVIDKKIETLSYDKTIKAVIVDVSRASDGIYQVSTGMNKFIAYSTELEYKLDDTVMVTVPQGDYNNQKIITGKWVDDTNTPLVYRSPFQRIVNVTNNIINEDVGEQALWANSNWLNDQGDFGYENEITIWESDGVAYSQSFSRIGLAIEVSSWLNEFNTAYGNYGVKLIITFRNNENTATFDKELIFDSNEFFGDVYNFETYFTQECIFDISDFQDFLVSKMKLKFYESGNFKNVEGQNIYYDTEANQVNSNLFLKDPYICLGLDTNDFKEDTATLITQDSLFYRKSFANEDSEASAYEVVAKESDVYKQIKSTEISDKNKGKLICGDKKLKIDIGEITDPKPSVGVQSVGDGSSETGEEDNSDTDTDYETPENPQDEYTYKEIGRALSNMKTIALCWVHKDKEKDLIKTILPSEFSTEDYEIRWYRYKLGEPTPDEFCGAHWMRFYGCKQEVDRATGECYLTKNDNVDKATNLLEVIFYPNVNNQTERLKAVVLRKIKNTTGEDYSYSLITTSNIIEFTNNDDVRSQATIIDLNALAIRYEDDEKGNYFLYNRAGEVNKDEHKEIRVLTAVFDPDEPNVAKKASLILEECESIEWLVPWGSNSMIQPATGSELDATPVKQDDLQDDQSNSESNKYYKIENQTSIGYFIKKTLNRTATHNTVKLKVVKDGFEYNAQIQMIFNTAGTSGSDYTLFIEWDGGEDTIIVEKDNNNSYTKHSITGQVHLMDQSGQVLEIPSDSTITVDWDKYWWKDIDNDHFRQLAKESKKMYYPVIPETSIETINNLGYKRTEINNQTFSFNFETGKFDIDENAKYPCLYTKVSGNTKLVFKPIQEVKVPENGNTQPPDPWDSSTETYIYGTKTKAFIKYKDVYILDPFNEYNESLTYYYPTQTTEYEYTHTKDSSYLTISDISNEDTNTKGKFIIEPNEGDPRNTLHILKVTLSNFGDYDLVATFPIPIKYQEANISNDNKQVTLKINKLEGPKEVRYSTGGEVDYNKNNYILWKTEFDQNQQPQLVYKNFSDELKESNENWEYCWRIFYDNTGNQKSLKKNIIPTLAYSYIENSSNDNDEIVPVPKKGYDIIIDGKYSPYLQPVGNYYEDTPLYGIQFCKLGKLTENGGNNNNNSNVIFEDDNNKYVIEEIYYTQPILVYRDNYPSTTLNKWNGKEINIDNDNGTIVANGMAAGKKESDNSFTGVVIGDWSRTDVDAYIAKNTGVYGFEHGAMSYALKDDGTAFFGKDGRGRIYFDGNKAQIYSSGWTDWAQLTNQHKGMFLDIDDGILKVEKPVKNNPGGVLQEGVKILLQPEDPFFAISVKQSNDDNALFKELLHIGDKKYYLQTADFQENNNNDGKGVKFDLTSGYLKGYNIRIEARRVGDNSANLDENSYKASSEYYLNNWSSNTSIPENGQGYQSGYEPQWSGTSRTGDTLTSGSDPKVVINSSAQTYPFQIGDNFKVSWNGYLSTSLAYLGGFSASEGKINNLQAGVAETGRLTATTASINHATIENATIKNAFTNSLTVSAEKGPNTSYFDQVKTRELKIVSSKTDKYPIGTLGYVTANAGDGDNSIGIGISVGSSAFKVTSGHAGFTAANGYVYTKDGKVVIGAPNGLQIPSSITIQTSPSTTQSFDDYIKSIIDSNYINSKVNSVDTSQFITTENFEDWLDEYGVEHN